MDLGGSDPAIELISKCCSLPDIGRRECPGSSNVVAGAQLQWYYMNDSAQPQADGSVDLFRERTKLVNCPSERGAWKQLK